MRIREIKVSKFKRFTDLTINDLPETARLVVLVGPNGCGKSSLFDAMNSYAKLHYIGMSQSQEESEYFDKGFVSGTAPISAQSMRARIFVKFHNDMQPSNWIEVFNMRSAYRHVQRIDAPNLLSRFDENSHTMHRVPRLISNDTEISANFQRLYSQAIKILFERKGKRDTEIIDGLTSHVEHALRRVLPDLKLHSLESPHGNTGSFYFAKGATERYVFENLSGGERSAFDLLLDMAIKRDMYPRSIQCIDEPESHIAMGVQGDLLQVMFDFIPEQSQLWIGTHSIGMLRAASKIAHERPGEVVFLNFHGKDFDKPENIEPITRPDRKFWREMHEVTLNDLAALVAPSTIIICESGKGFDAMCYNAIFSSAYPDVLFVSAGGKKTLPHVRRAFEGTGIKATYFMLRDKDQMNDREIAKYEADKGLVLSRLCIEKYLFDDEVLLAFCNQYGIPDSFIKFKEKRDNANGLKDQPSKIHSLAVELLKDFPIGDDPTTLMTDALAPLITPSLKVYHELHTDIFDTIQKINLTNAPQSS